MVRVIKARPRLGKSKPAPTLGDLLARQLKLVDRLGDEHRTLTRRLARARIRYSVLKQLNDSEAKRRAGQL